MAEQVLKGIRVIDFCWAAAGPLVGKHLGDHGAEVIRIESATRPCPSRRTTPFKDNNPDPNFSGSFLIYNTNKYGISLNMGMPRGIEIAKKFIAIADVVIENFSAQVMTRWGLGYENLVKIKPDIIMASMPIMGRGGPHERDVAFGDMLAGMAGITHLSGWSDRTPYGPYAYTDYVVPPLAVAAIVAALDYRRRTGRGQYVDISQFEASVHCIGPAILDYTVNGVDQNRQGNEHEFAAPHGAFPCKGDDAWCTIAVFKEEEWRHLREIIGDPRLNDPSFETLFTRKQNEDRLNEIIAAWTKGYTADEVMTRLQSNGVPAGIVYNIQELFRDKQLHHRNHFVKMDHPIMGEYTADAPPFRLSLTPGGPVRRGTLVGEDNEFVYKEILGLSEEEFIDLLVNGVLE